jgi:hypothetical protein
LKLELQFSSASLTQHLFPKHSDLTTTEKNATCSSGIVLALSGERWHCDEGLELSLGLFTLGVYTLRCQNLSCRTLVLMDISQWFSPFWCIVASVSHREAIDRLHLNIRRVVVPLGFLELDLVNHFVNLQKETRRRGDKTRVDTQHTSK